MSKPHGLAAYIAVTAAYWAFMLTDGALRMLVLLHFHRLGFSPVQLAYLFVLYEVAGMATNLSAGWLAARFGLTSTLYAVLSDGSDTRNRTAFFIIGSFMAVWTVLYGAFKVPPRAFCGRRGDLCLKSSNRHAFGFWGWR